MLTLMAFQRLPHDVAVLLLQFLQPHELGPLNLAGSLTHKLCDDEGLWKSFCLRVLLLQTEPDYNSQWVQQIFTTLNCSNDLEWDLASSSSSHPSSAQAPAQTKLLYRHLISFSKLPSCRTQWVTPCELALSRNGCVRFQTPLTSHIWAFEMRIVRREFAMAIGIVDTSADVRLGADVEYERGFYGFYHGGASLNLAWNGVRKFRNLHIPGCGWRPGDVVGVLVDMNTRELRLTFNGHALPIASVGLPASVQPFVWCDRLTDVAEVHFPVPIPPTHPILTSIPNGAHGDENEEEVLIQTPHVTGVTFSRPLASVLIEPTLPPTFQWACEGTDGYTPCCPPPEWLPEKQEGADDE